jgi:hypothetical protein
MRRIALIAFLALILPTGMAVAEGMFYVEVPKDGRIYVFNNPDTYTDFLKTGELEVRLTRIGEGPNGETLYFDNDTALHLYNFKHDRPDEVIPHAPATPPPPVQEKLPYRFSGLMFGDYYYNAARDAQIGSMSNLAVNGPEKQNGFQFRRIYFTFDDDLSDTFTTRFRLEADQGALSSNGKISVLVKDAYLKWKKAAGNSDLTFGIQPTPAYDYSETAWDFRSLEKTIMDLRGNVSSKDFGISLRGKFDSAGKYGYWVLAGNNSGNSPEVDKYKRFYVHFLYQPTSKFQLTVYEDIKQAPDIVSPNNPADKLGNNAFTTAFYASYGEKGRYNIGGETFRQSTRNALKIGSMAPYSIENRNAIGFSGWVWYQFNPRVGVVGRFDYYDPSRNSATKGDSRNLYIAGLYLMPFKHVYIIPNIEAETYEKLPSGQTLDASVTPRITFSWVFP